MGNRNLIRHFAEKLALAVMTIFVVATFNFFLIRFMPGDPLEHLVGEEDYLYLTSAHPEVLEELERVMHMEDIAIVLMTTKLIETCPEVISELKLKQKKPLIVEIPDRHGSAKIGETIDRYVSEAIGVKL